MIDIRALKQNGPTKVTKMKLLVYFKGVTCMCGSQKSSYHWDCLSCSQKRDPYINQQTSKACAAHIDAVLNFLEKTEENK